MSPEDAWCWSLAIVSMGDWAADCHHWEQERIADQARLDAEGWNCPTCFVDCYGIMYCQEHYDLKYQQYKQHKHDHSQQND